MGGGGGGEVRGLSCAVSRLRTARIIFPKHLNHTQSLEFFFIGCATHQPWRLSGDGGGVGEEVGLGWGGGATFQRCAFTLALLCHLCMRESMKTGARCPGTVDTAIRDLPLF